MQGAEEGGTWRQASHPDPGRNCDSEGEINANIEPCGSLPASTGEGVR